MAVLNVRDYGAKANAKYYNPIDGNWYQDPSFTFLADDDTQAFRNVLADAGLYNRVFMPVGDGFYNILGSLWFKGGTIFEGEDEHLAKMVLGSDFLLDPVHFRDGGNIYPILVTEDNSQDILMSNFSVEGNKKSLVGWDEWGMGGIVAQKTKSVKLEKVHVDWINISEDKTSRRYGFNIISVDADNIEYHKCSAKDAGYQPFGFFDRTTNSVMRECVSGMGWRTSVQVHRDTDNNKILNNSIIQEDNSFNREPHGAVTVHGEPGEEARNVLIDGNYIECGYGYKAAIQAFRKSIGLTVTNNEIWSNGEGLRLGNADNAVAEHNKIYALDNVKELEYGSIGINVVDGTKDSRIKYNKVVGFDTPIHEDFNLSNDVSDNDLRNFIVQQARLYKNVNGEIMEVKPYKKVDGVSKNVIPYVRY